MGFLAPFLFLLYINGLHLTIQNCLTYHFDTNLPRIGKKAKKIQKQINADLKG